MAGYLSGMLEHEFYDADKPAHPMALPTGVPFEVVRTEVVDQGYGYHVVPAGLGSSRTEEGRAVTFRHYVRRK